MLAIKNASPTGRLIPLALAGALMLCGCQPRGAKQLLEGERLIQQGRFTEAVSVLNDAARRLPTHPQVWNHLGLAYHGAGRSRLAAEAYQRALSLDRNFAVARYNLGCLRLEQGDITGALAELTTYTMLNAQSAPGWLRLGSAQLRARQYAAAEKSFNAALRLDSRLPEAWNGLGVAQWLRRQPREAYQCFTNALHVRSNYAPALLNLAIIAHQHLNEREFALSAYQQYLALAPAAPNAAAVRDAVVRLERELAPPPVASAPSLTNRLAQTSAPTNRPPPAPSAKEAPSADALTLAKTTEPTNLPPRTLATSPPPTNAAPKPAPAPSVASTPPAPTTLTSSTHQDAAPLPQQPKPEHPEPIQIVRVPDEPPVKPALDEAAAPLRSLPTATVEPSLTDTPPTPPPHEPPPAQEPTLDPAFARAPVVAEDKPSWLRRLNPLRWFKSREESTGAPNRVEGPGRVTPLNVPPVETTTASAEPPAARTEELTATQGVTPLPGTYEMRRYIYLSPPRPRDGDRRAAWPRFAAGKQAQEAGQLSEALAAYEEAVRLDPGFFEAHYNLGVAAQAAGDLNRALSAYEHALSINPTAFNARYNFSLALQRAGFSQDAANELEKALREHPDEARGHFALANLYAQTLYQTRQAREHYLRVLELEPQHPQATSIRYWLSANP